MEIRKCLCIKMNLKRNLASVQTDTDIPIRDVGRFRQASGQTGVFRNFGVLKQ